MKLSPSAFMQGMNQLAEVWPLVTSRSRLERYKKAVKELDDAAFAKMVDEFLDHAKFMPLPKDFADWAKMWRKKHTHAALEQTTEPYLIDCETCNDLGVICATNKQTASETLMRCHCQTGLKQSCRLPMLDVNFTTQLWDITKPSMDWFKPSSLDLKSIGAKAKEWRAKVRRAEEYWSMVGYDL